MQKYKVISRYLINEIVHIDNGSLFHESYIHQPLKECIDYLLCVLHSRS